MKRRDNLFAISMELLIVLVTLGILEPIKKVDFRYPHQIGAEGKINGYFRVNLLPNIVWMHIQNGYGVFINEYIETRDGVTINLVDEISKYYWSLSGNNVMSSKLKSNYLHRAIGNLIRYGNIVKKLPNKYDVHHKWVRWCNTQETLAIVTEDEHRKYHSLVSSYKSHRKGQVIYGVKAFQEWIKIIGKNSQYFNKCNM